MEEAPEAVRQDPLTAPPAQGVLLNSGEVEFVDVEVFDETSVPARPSARSNPSPASSSGGTKPEHNGHHQRPISRETRRGQTPLTKADPEPPAAPPPHSREAEEYVLCSCFMDGEDCVSKCLNAGVSARGTFWMPAHQVVFETINDLYLRNIPIGMDTVAQELRAAGRLEGLGGIEWLTEISSRIPTSAQAPYFIRKLREIESLRGLKSLGKEFLEFSDNYTGDPSDLLKRARNRFEQIVSGFEPKEEQATARAELLARLADMRFDAAITTIEPIPRLFINGRAISTAGNIVNLLAQAKAGKTAFLLAIITAIVCARLRIAGRDTLGVTASDPGSLRIIGLDTEQSRYDRDQNLRTVLRRAGIDALPPGFEFFSLAGFSAADLRQSLRLLMEVEASKGGLFLVIIDGAADLVNDVNDPEECNSFVAELHSLAIKYDCGILSVVHENPGQDGGKMRGHLGSQLERKAESNLRLKKADEITLVFSEKMRRAPILETDGPRFRWSDEAKMHVSCESSGHAKDQAKREKAEASAEAVFEHLGKPSARHSELLAAIAAVHGVKASAAEDRYTAMKKLGVISKDMVGAWRLNPVTP